MISDFFRTFVAGILSPTAFLGYLLIISCILLWKGKIRSGTILVSICAVFFFILGTSPLKTLLYSASEFEPNPDPGEYKYVVVLGARIFPNEKHPVSSQLNASLLARVSYGVSLVHAKKDAVLIVTGNGAGNVLEADLMAKMAYELGLPPEKVIVEAESMNTRDHPIYLRPILKQDKFLIVTSANHMNRALINFKAHGLEGTPAPTDYNNKKKSSLDAESFIMRGENFSAMDRWMTEMYSLSWTFVRKVFNI